MGNRNQKQYYKYENVFETECFVLLDFCIFEWR